MRGIKWKVGDIYTEKVKEFLGIDPEWNRVLTMDTERTWTVFKVYDSYILCQSELGYKAFQI